ncbi:MAG: hypothetical protein AAF485_20995, partial [Chloroflexota bacterium]
MFPETPNNWNDSTGWDNYWTETIAKNQYLDSKLFRDIGYLAYADLFEQRRVENVLFVGNGVSQAPKFFAYRGFNVVALDLSAVATNYAQDYRVDYDTFYRLFNDKYFHINKNVWV